MKNNAKAIQHEITKLKDKLALNPDDLDLLIKLSQHMIDSKNYVEAEKYLQYIEKIAPTNAFIKFFLGNVCCELNKFQEAILWYSQSVEINAFNSQTYFQLGYANNRLNNKENAILNFEKCLEFTSDEKEMLYSYNHLGLIYLNNGEVIKAITYFEKALAIDATSIILSINLSSALIRKGDLARSQAIIEKIPNDPNINFLCIIQKSRILKAAAKIDEAILCLERGLEQEPEHVAELCAELGEVFKAINNNSKADKYYKLALTKKNNDYSVLLNLANLAIERQEHEIAKKYIEQILKINSCDSMAYLKLASVCRAEKNLDAVIHCAEIAMLMDPTVIEAYIFAAEGYLMKYFESGYNDHQLEKKAINLYLKALEISPNDPNLTFRIGYMPGIKTGTLQLKLVSASLQQLFAAYDKLTNKATDPLYFTQAEAIALAMYCINCVGNVSWKQLEYAKPILEKVVADQLHEKSSCCIPIFSSHYLFPQLNLQKKLAKSYSSAYKSINSYQIYDTASSSKLRIGYISPDFNSHVVGFLIDKMFAYHDREQFEIYGYSLRQKYDEQRNLIAQSCDHFKELTELTNKDAAEVIYNDKIDILIDLAGYTAGCRPGILSYKPAPIQAHFFGQVGTMGADFMHYHLATEAIVPESHVPYYSEKIVYLPETIVASKQFTLPEQIPTKEEYGLPDTGIIFCCFNNHYRIDKEVFTCWMNILQAVPNSVLWLSSTNNENITHLKDYAKAKQVDPERLIFKVKTILNNDWHHRLADLYLDTFTIAAGTTSILSAWVGLPVLTWEGNTPQSIFGVGIMQATGIMETIAKTKKDYFNIAVDLALNPSKLTAIKKALLNNRLQSPLFNQQRYIKHLEKAYQLMYENYKTGSNNKTIKVPKL